MRRFTALLLAALMLLSLAACGQGASAGGSAQNAAGDPTPEEEAPELPEPEPYEISDPMVMPEGGVRDGVTYAAYDGIVEHLFFHPVVAYPELAFDGDAQANGIDDYMVTVDEYNKILQSVYDKGYVLVDIGDVWSETTGEDGQPKMVRNTLYLPEGKKPLILSYDDTNYYEYMLANGFTYKLVIGEDGKIASWGKDPQGNEVTSRDLDAIPILDKFVEEHLDFSPFGAKGCLSLTGYQGILGYRTQTDQDVEWTAEREANRQKEIEAVKPIIAELKRTGWTFGSHTWGHIRLGTKSLESIQADTQRWFDEWAAWWVPLPSCFTLTGSGPTATTGRTPARCSNTSRARASESLPPWALRASAISRRISAPSSATGSTRTAPPCAIPETGTCNFTTQRISWM